MNWKGKKRATRPVFLARRHLDSSAKMKIDAVEAVVWSDGRESRLRRYDVTEASFARVDSFSLDAALHRCTPEASTTTWCSKVSFHRERDRMCLCGA